MQLDHTHLKVDQTVMPYGENLLLVSNINIPVDRLTTDLDQVLERADNFVRRDYINLPPQTYTTKCAPPTIYATPPLEKYVTGAEALAPRETN